MDVPHMFAGSDRKRAQSSSRQHPCVKSLTAKKYKKNIGQWAP